MTKEQWAAFRVAAFSVGRHAITYSAGAATGVAGVLTIYGGLLHFSGDEVTSVVGAFNAIAAGIKSIVEGVGTIVGAVSTLLAVGMAWWARWSISPKQAATVAADTVPDIKIVAPASIANTTPNQANIVSNDTHAVTEKAG